MRVIAKVVYDNTEELAGMVVDVTEMGGYDSKGFKNRDKAKIIWNSLKGKKSVGIIDYDNREKFYYVAKPLESSDW